jgi:predicted O-linked N-acetylglucosamine transferase (SPINDLY family)
MDDETTKDYQKFLNNWFNVRNFTDEELINLIRSNNIEILVDLSGFTKGHRMSIFYNKAAPIQVTWCGYLASTGFKEIDYIIADKYTVLSGDESKYSEKVYKLNKTWSVLKPIYNAHVNQEVPFCRNKFISFASFNNIKKINYKVIQLWCKILNNIKNSRLHLVDKNFSDKEFDIYFKNFFQNNGVKNEQLSFHDSFDRIELLKMYNSVDIALDPFPYSGGTTSLESYWMCVPVLTKKGNYFISKSTESINRNIGLDNWIANDEDDYLSKAISFSKDLNFLQNTKNYLINNRNKFVIFDSEHLAEELSLAFKSMLKNYKSA